MANFGWLFFPYAVFLLSSTLACEAPAGTNFSDHPKYWCSLDARVSLSTECNVDVEEIIKLPWASGILHRSVPTEDNQRVEDVSAYHLLDGIRISKLSATQRREAPNNRLLSIHVGQRPEHVSVLITYKKIGGVRIFSQCSRLGSFEAVKNSEARTVMLSEWAVGGRSISSIQDMTVTFFLNDRKLEYIDSQATVPERFTKVSQNNASSSNDEVRVSYNGRTAELSPSQLIFYIRYYMQFGALSCRGSRNCKYENMILNEGQSSNVSNKIIIGVSLTLALIVVAAGIGILVLYCKRVKQGQLDSDLKSETLPASLRHFEYDTGDDDTGEKRAEQVWMSNKSNDNDIKEEFYALDLSPRRRREKSSEEF